MFFALGLMALMIFMSMMASRKEKKRMATLLSSIKRHDRVMLAGGMIGTIAEVRDDEVVVKVDDATNTRIHFRKSSVQQVLRSASGDGSASESSAA
jgi:preprotein translocase subunit YajC